jgi:PEP-CTERM motif
MKPIRIVGLPIALGLSLVAGSARAALLEDFQFMDPDFTSLSGAMNSASSHMWVEDTDHVATIQVLGGELNIVKNDTNFVTEGLEIDDVSSGTLWMVAEFSDWAILGSAEAGQVEEIRFGFNGTADLVPPPSSTVLAEMMISRNFDAGEFQISGTALGTAGTDIAPAAINFVQTQPFTMAMEVDQDSNTYSIYYKDGAAPYTLLGTGNLEPTRDALITRFTVNNFIGDVQGEFADLDRFYISDTPPVGIPEPGTIMLAALALSGAGLRRRAASSE